MDGSVQSVDGEHIRVGRVPEGYDAKLIVEEMRRSGHPVVHVARDDRRLVEVRDALAFWDPTIEVLSFPAWDCLPYERVSPNSDLAAKRTATLATIAQGYDRPFVLVTTMNAVTQRIPERRIFEQVVFAAHIGKQINFDQFRNFLNRAGFVRTATVMEPGDFAIRGGIIDIFPPNDAGPIRLDLFGDVLEAIRRFDPATQLTTGQLDKICLAPASEIILDDASIARFRSNYRSHFASSGVDDPLYEAVSSGRKQQGIEHWLPFFYERLHTFFDYLPDASITLDDDVTQIRHNRWDAIKSQYQARKSSLNKPNLSYSAYRPLSPELLYLDDESWNAALTNRRVLHFNVSPQAPGSNVINAEGRLGRQFAIEKHSERVNLFAVLARHVRDRLEYGPVVVASYSEGARERLSGLIEDEGLIVDAQITDVTQLKTGGVHVAVWPLEHGFELPNLSVISEQDILGERLIRIPRKRRQAENFIAEVDTLKPGDLVVHIDHGIGRYNGLEVVTVAGLVHECLSLTYAENAKFYLPVENIELLSRYGSDDGILDRLGGVAWQARKARLKNRIRDIAYSLIKVAAEREVRHAPVIVPERHAWEEFASRFPYLETEDQAVAIEEVMHDLSQGQPMDRLICGDVGFGKTEVAMRAAFAVAMAGFQVVLIAPTTLLVRQHFASFRDRFEGFPVDIHQLSRLITPTQAGQTRDAIADGSASIVIGTHALLSKKISFKNLGLLIIDEEQNFGVTHKERLKALKTDLHVLTLTATPIPRTLQLSLSGLRNLSLIRTPPVDRIAIRTYVGTFDPVTVREALLREYYRGGQSFFVVPRVSDIPEVEDFIDTQVPEVKAITAHGRLVSRDLETRVNAFYDGKYDVLIATTIIESGLDIPTANTLILYRSDKFGLAQLYQIRGRIGRSKTRAYAYLTTKPRTNLTVAASKRLRVLGSLDALGVGFHLASQDLEIRGAGNLLGDEQSGRIREVGYELYQSMLETAILRLKVRGYDDFGDIDDQWTPQINLGISILIPESFVSDLDVRLGLYRRLSKLSTKVEVEGFAAELIDRFGKLPKEVNALLVTVRMKSLCRQTGIVKLDAGPNGATLQFHEQYGLSTDKLVRFLEDYKDHAKFKNDRVVMSRDWTRDRDRIKGAFEVVRDLARLVRD